MHTRLLSGAAAVASGAALALTAGSPTTAQATTGPHGWRIVKIIGAPSGTSGMYDIVATGPADAWAAGTVQAPPAPPRLSVEHWNGRRWQPIAPPRRLGSGLVAGPLVAASSSVNAWVFPYIIGKAGHSDAVRWQGARWEVTMFPAGVRILGAAVFDRSDAWAFGEIRARVAPFRVRPYVVRFDGRRWRQVSVPVVPDFVAARSPAAMWAIGPTPQSANGGQPIYALARWDGRTWRTVSLHWPAGSVPGGIAALGPRDVWFADNRYSGGTLAGADMNIWNPRGVFTPFGQVGSSFSGLAPDGRTGVWLAAFTPSDGVQDIEHVIDVSGTSTSQAVPATADHVTILARLVLIARTRSVWAVGTLYAHGYTTSQGVILKYGA